MITREQALKLLHNNMQNINLRRHCYAVEAVMRVLAKRFKEDEEKWGIIGLLHDGDYEKTKEAPEKHTLLMAEWLKEAGETDKEMLSAILSHNYAHTGKNPPKNKLEWSLYCCDELTGFIVAVALVRPDKKLASVAVDSILKKWDQKAFAAGVKREQIEECEPRLEIPLREFIEIALIAMQGISNDLGL
jgi:predicted hydrolase (HD superfamily)